MTNRRRCSPPPRQGGALRVSVAVEEVAAAEVAPVVAAEAAAVVDVAEAAEAADPRLPLVSAPLAAPPLLHVARRATASTDRPALLARQLVAWSAPAASLQ